MTNRQPNLPLGHRTLAAGCVVLWLAAVSACGLEASFCADSPGNEVVAHTDSGPSHHGPGTDDQAHHPDDAEAHHSHVADGPSHDSHKHDSREGSCCSTLKAVVKAAKPVVFSKPAFPPIPFLCVFQETRSPVPPLSENPPSRQAKTRDRDLMPEVCPGPAHRSLAPPSPA